MLPQTGLAFSRSGPPPLMEGKAIYCNSRSGQRCDLAEQNGKREKERELGCVTCLG
jgi:hypothetical protein